MPSGCCVGLQTGNKDIDPFSGSIYQNVVWKMMLAMPEETVPMST